MMPAAAISAAPAPTASRAKLAVDELDEPVEGMPPPPGACTVMASEAEATHAPVEAAVTVNVPVAAGAVMTMLAVPLALAVACPRVTPPAVKTTTALAQNPLAVRVTEEPAVGLLLLVVTVGVPVG